MPPIPPIASADAVLTACAEAVIETSPAIDPNITSSASACFRIIHPTVRVTITPDAPAKKVLVIIPAT